MRLSNAFIAEAFRNNLNAREVIIFGYLRSFEEFPGQAIKISQQEICDHLGGKYLNAVGISISRLCDMGYIRSVSAKPKGLEYYILKRDVIK